MPKIYYCGGVTSDFPFTTTLKRRFSSFPHLIWSTDATRDAGISSKGLLILPNTRSLR